VVTGSLSLFVWHSIRGIIKTRAAAACASLMITSEVGIGKPSSYAISQWGAGFVLSIQPDQCRLVTLLVSTEC
jgi:hypothetical protein